MGVALLAAPVTGCSDDDPVQTIRVDASAHPIVYMSAERDGDGEAFHLWLMKEDGSDPRQLTDGSGTEEYPSWSPDGSRIAFAGSAGPDDDYDIFVVNSDGNQLRQVTDTEDQDEGVPSWSPDGSRVLYVAGTANEDTSRLLVLDVDHPAMPTVVATNSQGWPDWSPDGEQVLYTGPNQARDDLQLWIADADGSHVRILETAGLTTAYESSWSPDGTQIAFVTPAGEWTPDDPTQMNEDIWVMTAHGTRARRVVSTPGNDHWPPTWSPDGRQLLYTADGKANEGEITAVELATGVITTLTDNEVHDMYPHWRAAD